MLLKGGEQLESTVRFQLADLSTKHRNLLNHVILCGILDVDEITSGRLTLLVDVCSDNNVSAAEFLLSQGASVSPCKRKSLVSPLHMTLLKQHVDLTKLLLKQPDIDVYMPLSFDEKVKILMSAFHKEIGAFKTCFGCDIWSMEHLNTFDLAVFIGNKDIVSLLHDKNPHSIRTEGSLSIHLCLITQNTELLDFLSELDPIKEKKIQK